MADNLAIDAGIVATDEVGSVHTQRVKVTHGADGTVTDASAAAPLPVSLPAGSQAVETELPAAAALGDNANPTAPMVGAAGLVWDGALWRRQREGYGVTFADSKGIASGIEYGFDDGADGLFQRRRVFASAKELLASASRTVATSAGLALATWHRGIIVMVNVTVYGGSGGIKIRCAHSTPTGAALFFRSPLIDATGYYAVELGPGATSGLDAGIVSGDKVIARQAALINRCAVVVEVDDATAHTYSLSYMLTN